MMFMRIVLLMKAAIITLVVAHRTGLVARGRDAHHQGHEVSKFSEASQRTTPHIVDSAPYKVW